MALLFIDGFEARDAPVKWSSAVSYYGGWGTGPQVGSITGRFGTGTALQIYNYAGQGMPYLNKMVTPSAKIIIGFGTSITGANFDFLVLFGDGGFTSHLTMNFNASGGIDVKRGATVIASTAASIITSNVWYHFEVSATISATVGTVTLRLNGATVLNFTGNTKNGGTVDLIDAVKLQNPSSGPQFSFDDFYVCNDSGSTNNVFLGDVQVQTLMPSAAGTSTQFTPTGVANNWDNVNDIPYSAADYNTSSTVGQRDTYALADLVTGTGTVFGVQNTIIALKSDAGAASIKAAMKSGGTVYYDANQNLGASLSSTVAMHETDPATAAAWTPTNVNALEFGAEAA